jgi:hypothetical protein
MPAGLYVEVRETDSRKRRTEMKNLRTYSSRYALSLFSGLVLTLTSIPAVQGAATSTKPWTTIGSAGAEHLGTFTYQNGIAFLSSPSGIIRYNVVAVDGLMETGPVLAHIRMAARFRDPDAASRVTVNLRRTRLSDGFTANVPGVFLDSNNYPAGNFQTRNTVCASTLAFDFVNYVYYVEVILTRAAGAIAPAIEAIQIGWDNGPCLVAP